MLVTGSFFAVVAVLASRSSAQVTSPAVTATGDPCAVVSSLVASQPQGKPPTQEKPVYVLHLMYIDILATPVPIITPSKALACLDAVPLDNAKASAFIDYLRPFLQFQSSLVYLKNPPTGYMVPGVDILGGLDQIQNNIQSGTYKSHWDFEKDYNTLINIMPKDFHLYLGGSVPLASVILFGTALHLVSVSSDGLKVPQIYVKCE